MKKTGLLEFLILGVLPFSTKLVVEAVNGVPDNDLCQDAQTVSIGGTATGNLFGATTDDNNLLPEEFKAQAGKFDRGIWFRVIGNGGALKASTCIDNLADLVNQKTLPIMGGFKGASCNDLEMEFFSTGWADVGATDCSAVNFQTELNQIYWIVVDEQGSTTDPEAGNVGLKIELVEAPTFATVYGDPHISLWSGKHYDFHGACDLVLLKNPSFRDGMGLTIHIRTKFTKEWSFIESAVIRLGSDTFELKGSKDETLYWINGEFSGDLGKGIAGYPLEFKETSSHQKEFVLRLNEKEEITLKTFKELVRVDISFPTVQSFGSSEGLLGRYPTGERLGRDRETVIDDSNTFGQEWQVLADEDMLFHAVDGAQAPNICPLPDSTSKTVRRRRLSASSITVEDAKVACSRVDPNFFDSCVFDVLAINDKDVAGSY